MNKLKLVRVFEAANDIEGEYIRLRLDEAGIDCMVKNPGLQGIYNIANLSDESSILTGGTEIYVRSEDFVEARAIIDDIMKTRHEESGEGDRA